MIHLIRYSFLSKLRNFNVIFWPLVFPVILGTFFYFAFGNLNEADFETVSVGIVKEEQTDEVFLFFLDQIQTSEKELIHTEEMSQEKALNDLKKGEISGIYYVGKNPSLTVAASGLPESILQTLLENYENTRHTIQNITRAHPEGLLKGIREIVRPQNLLKDVSLGGKTIDGTVQFFYALIAMACLYGCFIGFHSALGIQANITPLAARRCVTPTHKFKLIFTDQITSFALGYVDVILLILYLRYVLKLDFQGKLGSMLVISFFGSMIGVSMGMFIGSIGKMQEEIKIGILLGVSMVSSFLAGLMNNTMKDIVERNVPLLNRINPAALISDAFYCINVYDDMGRYYRNLFTLAAICIVLVTASFFMVRRERYDSI